MTQHTTSNSPASRPLKEQLRLAKTAIATRLRYVRHEHPEGPFTLGELAERAGVSKRTLVSAESSDGTNLTVETLVKVAHSLGIERWAYFLDEQVFREVNTELDMIKELRERNVRSVALRTAHPTHLPVDQVAALLRGIIESAGQAHESLRGIASPSEEHQHHPDESE
ncbi:helix-turn-helix domain-containing protein [Streptomyces rubellomurinus]|uniref:helix-turn-helix domain-containing protein n=1 Tax=Streptomyces rubellomurinus (strain ATCC 31215) TaxID=359131 RepID=UPI0005F13560|nr:helix-turn-helix domain-containing protein [Streptomyces rubellomurinus]